MRYLLKTLSFILRHPLNQHRKAAALSHFVRWQLGSRLVPGAVAVPFVDSTRLLVQPGMKGATGNIYCGLQDFEDMAFILQSLRPGDLFVDVGANVGSYTVLAAGGAGANCLAFEPVPSTFVNLLDNIRLNNIESKATPRNIAIGAASASLAFTTGLHTVNHVVADGEAVGTTIRVPVEPLDSVLAGSPVTVMKIDVEGFETEVLNGASDAMQRDSLLAVVMELNGSGLRYGHDEIQLHQRMLRWGFTTARYDPLQRKLTAGSAQNNPAGNTLYVRDVDSLQNRLRTAPRHTVQGNSL